MGRNLIKCFARRFSQTLQGGHELNRYKITSGLMLACLVAGLSFSSSAQDRGVQVRPAISFITPQDNARITDYPIYIETEVRGFTLAAPVQYWDKVSDQDRLTGHIHYTLDDSPIMATRRTKVVMGKPGDNALPVGKHILRAELVTPNHEPLNPPSFAEITIICERGADNGGGQSPSKVLIDKRGREQLKNLEQKIQQVQQQVWELKGRLHDVGNP